MPTYLRPTAPTASHALLPSDPGQALAIAQALLEAPRMSNHSHGLWGYHGETDAGATLSIQSTGIGGPSAAAVLRELWALGVRRAVRVGGCVPLQRGLEPGHSIVAEGALAGDGTSAALGAEGYVAADGELTGDLIRAAGPNARAGTVQGADLLGAARRPSTGALAADLESAALFALGAKLGVAVGSLLVVGSLRPPGDGGGVAEHVAGSDVGLAEHVAGGYVELARIASAALNAQERSPGPGVSTRP